MLACFTLLNMDFTLSVKPLKYSAVSEKHGALAPVLSVKVVPVC